MCIYSVFVFFKCLQTLLLIMQMLLKRYVFTLFIVAIGIFEVVFIRWILVRKLFHRLTSLGICKKVRHVERNISFHQITKLYKKIFNIVFKIIAILLEKYRSLTDFTQCYNKLTKKVNPWYISSINIKCRSKFFLVVLKRSKK